MANAVSTEGESNLNKTMKYKNKHRLLGIKRKKILIIQAFLENNAHK